MKKHLKEMIILLVQLFMFYIFPMFVGPTDVMGMVALIWLSTILLALIIGVISKEKIKYFYSIIIALLFIPSIFIYYNSSALIHSIWYFVSSTIGLVIGTLINKLIGKKRN